MDWQWVAVTALIVLACCYLARRAWNTWLASRRGCAGGCGCGSKSSSTPEPVTMVRELTLRSRI